MDTWLLLLVMSLATYRLTRLVVEDTFPPALWLRDRIAGGWRPLTEAESEVVRGRAGTPDETKAILDGGVAEIDGVTNRYVRRWRWVPQWIADLLSCPWCASGWIALAVTAGTWAWVGLPMPVLVWFAVWAVGALIAGQEWA
jgi:hypothetical protein